MMFWTSERPRYRPTGSRLRGSSRKAALAADWEWFEVGINNVVACAAKLAEMCFWSRLLCQISFEMLDDQPRDRAGCAKFNRKDTLRTKAPETEREPRPLQSWVFLFFFHRSGWDLGRQVDGNAGA